jgi:hypothetical protein
VLPSLSFHRIMGYVRARRSSENRPTDHGDPLEDPEFISPVDGSHYRATHHDSRAAPPIISHFSFFTLHPWHQQHASSPKEDPQLSLEHSMNLFHCASQIFGKAILPRGWGNIRTCR